MMIPGDENLRNVVISLFYKVFRRALESRVWTLGMYGFDVVEISLVL